MNIKELTICTTQLANQVDFYARTIGLDVLEHSASQACFQIGRSRLTFKQKGKVQPYHFAINIPCNKEKEAWLWLKERVEILKDGEVEIQDFDFWNAKAIYFYDTDKNIVEFIARKNMRNESQEAFGVHALLEVSEIGVPVNDIEKTVSTLRDTTNIEIYDGGFERFCAVGDEYGLFICINKQVKDWFPTGDKAHPSEFEIVMEESGQEHIFAFAGGALFPVPG